MSGTLMRKMAAFPLVAGLLVAGPPGASVNSLRPSRLSASISRAGNLAGKASTTTAASPSTALSMGNLFWGSTWSYNPFSADFLEVALGFVDLPLAVQVPPKATTFVPELASSWTREGNDLVVHVRPGLKWQNGQPVTSTDVYDTALLDGTEGSVWPDTLAKVSAPSRGEVVFAIRKGVPLPLAEVDILGMTVYPASVYGKFITPSLRADEEAYYAEDATDPTAAGKMTQYKAMSEVVTNVSKLAPKTMIGDGPFRLESVTTLEAKMVSWKGFYDAAKIHLGGIDFYNGTSNQMLYPLLYSGRLDFTNPYMPESIVEHWLRLPDAHVALSAPQEEYGLAINDHRYPLNITKVRQALAYLVPRSQMIALTYGTKDGDAVPAARPDGLDPVDQRLYLTASQIRSLKTYAPNSSRASALLRSAGFHKRGKRWFMPNGKPFTLVFLAASSESDIVTSFKVAATDLSRFGISSTVSEVPEATQYSDLIQGNFELTRVHPYSLDPLLEFDQVLGSGDNFISIGSAAGDRGLGFGPHETVPGLGRVDVPATIDAESSSVVPGRKMRTLVWDWARLVNRQVPFIEYGSKVWQMAYSTARFTGWPSKTSTLWDTIGDNYGGGWLLLLESGTLHPKH